MTRSGRAAACGLWCTLWSVAWLAGCAQAPTVPTASLAGRLALRIEGQDERSFSAGFELSGDAQQGTLWLTGPLGATAAKAAWSPGEAWLVADKGRQDFADLDALSTAALGEPVPLAALFDWLRGQAWRGAPVAARGDGVAGFEQLGWRIDLSRWADGWIEAQRRAVPVVTVRARLERP